MDWMAKKRLVVKAAMLGCAAGSLLTAWHASAQEAGDDLNDIIVTAQRREERLVDVPAAIVAIRADALEKAGVSSIHDLDQLAAGVKIEFNGNFTQPAIRGVTTLTTGTGFENNVAIYIDGFYSPDTLSINTDFVNLENVQIFKGPQGTLYGRNATGGAILFTTLSPAKEFTADAEVSYARFDDKSIRGYVSGPLSDQFRFSLGGYHRRSDGYYKYVDPAGTGKLSGNAAPLKQDSLRAKLEGELGEAVTATLGFNYGLSSDPRGGIFTNIAYAPLTIPAPPFAARAPYQASTNFPTQVESTLKEGTAKVAIRTGAGTITSYTGYATRKTNTAFDFDSTYARVVEVKTRWRQKTFQQTVDWNVEGIENVDLVIGANYYRDTNRNIGSNSIIGGNIINWNYATLKSRAWAVYADSTYHITSKLTFGVGGRYTKEKKHIDFVVKNAAQTVNTLGPSADNTKFSSFTPRAVLRYELAESTNVYASLSRGFRSGGYQPSAVAPALLKPFRPEKITAYEVGFKTAQQGFRFDIAAFYYDYKDLQVAVTQPNPATGGLINFVSNAPKARIYGLDVQGSVKATTGFDIGAGISLIHGRYINFRNAASVGLSAAGLNVDQTQNWSGLQMARAPSISGNVNASYETVLAKGKLELSGNVSFTSSYPQSNPSLYGPLAGPALANKQRFKVGPYEMVNAQVSWTEPSGHLKATVFVTNITKTLYLMNYGGTSLFGDVGVYNQPRTLGGRLAFTY